MKYRITLVVLTLASMVAFESLAAVRYVNAGNTAPAAPYTSWATAAVTIQDAVDAAFPFDEIVVANGVYQTGGRAVSPLMTNRVAVTKPLNIHSVNGPGLTLIQGYQVPSTTNGDGAVRCVYLTSGASLSGFTPTNGATLSTGDIASQRSGGGVWSRATSTVVSNCVLVGNSVAVRINTGPRDVPARSASIAHRIQGTFPGRVSLWSAATDRPVAVRQEVCGPRRLRA